MYVKILKPFVFMALFISLVGMACLSGGGGGSSSDVTKEAPTQSSESNTKPSSDGSGAVNNLQDVQKATIQIVAQGTSVDPVQGTQLNSGWSGSGFFINDSGLAVTNNHVVTGAAILKVYVGGESKSHSAKVVGVSECADLAVIQVDGSGFSYLNWYEDPVKVGMEVYAAGYPLGEPEFNLTKGIVSKEAADGQTYWSSLDSVIAHDATINPGNSGGPLVTTDGKVVGINYRSRAEQNQYFAISAADAIPLVKTMESGKDVDSIGVNGEAFVFGPNNEYPGIWVYSVKSGSPADKAGVKAGDILLEIESILLSTDGTFKDYCDVLQGHNPDQTLSLRVYRPTTDEILEGQLNGRALEVTGYGGLTGVAGQGDTTTTTSSTSGDWPADVISTEFDTDFMQEGWRAFVVGDDSDYVVKQKPGRAYVEVNTPSTSVYVVNDTFWGSDVRVETYETKVGGPNTMNVSLICRASDKGWYEFSITSGGQWQIWKYDPATSSLYSRLAKGNSTKIGVQKTPNLLQATCIGDTLTFYANGEQIGQTTDRDFTEGQVGFSVSTFNIKGSQVEFEYFNADKNPQ